MNPLGKKPYIVEEQKKEDHKNSNMKTKPVSQDEKEQLKEKMKKYIELKFKERELEKKWNLYVLSAHVLW